MARSLLINRIGELVTNATGPGGAPTGPGGLITVWRDRSVWPDRAGQSTFGG